MNKAHILAEIKRTAEANGGVPLGITRFEAETGITRSDWYGKFWARWGDALREAGFAPNQLQGAYEITDLLGQNAKHAQELGRLPSSGDLLLKTRTDPDFPARNTFGRLGSKPELVRQLLDYCRGRDGFEDVVQMCEEYAPPDQEQSNDEETDEVQIGFVYLLKSGKYYKIGKTNSAGRRERELAIQLPEKATTVHVIRTDDPTGIAAYWHKRFEAKRRNGEWFKLSAADVAAFKRRKFM
jgi:hypothetical protein